MVLFQAQSNVVTVSVIEDQLLEL